MRHVIRPLLATLALTLAACGGRDSSPIKTTSAGGAEVSPAADSVGSRGHSLVRVVNATSGGKTITVQLGDRTLFNELAAGTVSDYSEVATNLAMFSVLSAAAPGATMLSQADRILVDGNRYTVFVITKDVAQQELRVVRDDVIPDSGKARIRLIHAAPGGPEFDVQSPGTVDRLFRGVKFLAEAGPTDLNPAASIALELRAAGESRILLKLPSVELRRSTTTTFVVTGTDKLVGFYFVDAMMKATPKP